MRNKRFNLRARVAGTVMAVSLIALVGCSSKTPTSPLPDLKYSRAVEDTLREKNMPKTAPIMIRIFKEEDTLEVWKQTQGGKFELAASYDICVWSGKLGPKYAEGDRQAPEGFYNISRGQMNPNSKYHLAFNIGFPNVYDRINGRYGTHLMVHGACSSAGCYSMNDDQIEEIYAFARDAFRGGQRSFQLQAFPFRMTERNMARYRNDPNYEFWTMLKQGYDAFEETKVPPRVDVCEKRYAFNLKTRPSSPTATCPRDGNVKIASAYVASQSPSLLSHVDELWTTSNHPAPSIRGIEEAAIIADWSQRRARGEKVTPQPPNLSEVTKEHIEASLSRVRSLSRKTANIAAQSARQSPVVVAREEQKTHPRRF